MSKAAFFRQSGWMVISSVITGVFMFSVHFFSKKIPESEYGILGTLLSMLNCMGIPAIGLQMVFAQQAAGAVTEDQERQLAGTTRAVLAGTFLIWIVMAVVVWLGYDAIVARLKFSNPAALLVTLLLALAALWSPIFSGLVQGRQNFLWLGWATIIGGVGRFVCVAVAVLLLGGYATGIITAALIGLVAAVGVAAWQSRAIWRRAGAPFAWRPWLARVLPLTFGFGAFQFLFSADPIFVQNYFDPDKTFAYMAAGTLSRALVTFTAPLAAVMFPKIVHSLARSEKSNVLLLTLATTAVLAGLGAIGLSLIAPLLLKLVFKSSFLEALPYLPWFAWSMTPLALTNVLVNNLLARERFGVVVGLVLVAAGYGLALTQFHDSFLMVIKTIGVFNLLALAVAGAFTWWDSRRAK